MVLVIQIFKFSAPFYAEHPIKHIQSFVKKKAKTKKWQAEPKSWRWRTLLSLSTLFSIQHLFMWGVFTQPQQLRNEKHRQLSNSLALFSEHHFITHRPLSTGGGECRALRGGFGLHGCMAVPVTVSLQTDSSASWGFLDNLCNKAQQIVGIIKSLLFKNLVYKMCPSHTWIIIQLVLSWEGGEIPEAGRKGTSILHKGGWEAMEEMSLLILLQGTSEKWHQWCNLQTREQNGSWAGK